MKENAAIGSWQFAILLFLSRMMQFFLAAPSAENMPGGVTAAIWLAVSAVTTVAVLVPAYLLGRKHQHKDFAKIAYEKGKVTGHFVSAVFALFALGALVQTVCAFSYFLASTAYPETSPGLFIVFTILVGGYGAAMGYEPTARFGGIVLAVFVIVGVAATVLLAPGAMWEYLRPPVYDSAQTQTRLWVRFTFGNLELAVLVYMLSIVKEKKNSVFFKWSAMALLAMEGTVILTTVVLGDYALTQRFPFYGTSRMVQGRLFEQLDLLIVFLWVFLAVVRIALYLGVMGKALAFFLPEKAKKFSTVIGMALTAVAAGICNLLPTALTKLNILYFAGGPVIITVIVLPLVLLILPGKGDHAHENH